MAQLERILGHSLFASTHRLSDFLRYVCQAALDGRTEIDQKEIAHSVLGRDDSFDPGEDAYVRKIATTVRQRLRQYYAGAGRADPLLILVPQGSYLPHFETVAPPAAAVPPPNHFRLAALLVLALIFLGVLVILLTRQARPVSVPGQFTLLARRGSILTTRNDAPAGSILLGPPVSTTDQLVVRMVFTPLAELDQAGVMIFDDADNYVVLSRQLQQRNYLHFAAERRGAFSRAPETFIEDPRAQTGEPVWLAIRRNGDEFRAFSSADGDTWRPLGSLVHANLRPGQAHVALFALRELDKDPPPTAVFDRLGIGPPLATWDAPGSFGRRARRLAADGRLPLGTHRHRPSRRPPDGFCRQLPALPRQSGSPGSRRRSLVRRRHNRQCHLGPDLRWHGRGRSQGTRLHCPQCH